MDFLSLDCFKSFWCGYCLGKTGHTLKFSVWFEIFIIWS